MVVALLLGLGGGLAMFALIAALAVPLQRWSDSTGYYEGRRQVPLGKSLVLIAFICVMSGLGRILMVRLRPKRRGAWPTT